MNFQSELTDLIRKARFEEQSDEDILNQIALAIKFNRVKSELSKENILAYAEKNVPMGDSRLIWLIKAARQLDPDLGLIKAKALVHRFFSDVELYPSK